jgi:type II secretory pathway component PulF
MVKAIHHFTYVARDAAGRLNRGALAADSPLGLKAALAARGLQLVSLQPASRSGTAPTDRLPTRSTPAHRPSHSPSPRSSAGAAHPRASAPAHGLPHGLANPLGWLPVRQRDIEFTFRQMAVMLRTGLDLLSILGTLSQQSPSPAMTRVMLSLRAAVESGESLASAMHRQRCFPPMSVQLVRVGENTGSLADVLEQASEHMSQRRTAIAEVRMALAYPLVVGVAAVGIAVYLIFAVIPELKKFLNALGRKLPAMTQSLVDLAVWCQAHGPTLLLACVALVSAGCLLMLWPPGRLVIDRCLLRVPVVGSIVRLAGTATFASSLAIMVRNGVHLVEALRIAVQLQNNRWLARSLSDANQSVLRGESLARSLPVRGGFLPMLTSMVAIAERTGKLDDTLDEVARFCAADLRTRIKRMSLLVEPVIIIVAGGIVGYVYMAFFMALMSAAGHIQ